MVEKHGLQNVLCPLVLMDFSDNSHHFSVALEGCGRSLTAGGCAELSIFDSLSFLTCITPQRHRHHYPDSNKEKMRAGSGSHSSVKVREAVEV